MDNKLEQRKVEALEKIADYLEAIYDELCEIIREDEWGPYVRVNRGEVLC